MAIDFLRSEPDPPGSYAAWRVVGIVRGPYLGRVTGTVFADPVRWDFTCKVCGEHAASPLRTRTLAGRALEHHHVGHHGLEAVGLS